MSGFVEGIDRSQSSLFPAELEDYVAEDNLVRAVDAFVDGLASWQAWLWSVCAAGKRAALLSSGDAAQDIHLWLSQSRPIEPSPRARVPAQHRADLADGASGTGLQDHCGFP